jgi:hypothetical protein
MQVRNTTHKSRSIHLNEDFETGHRNLDEDGKRFFKLFEESTEDGSQAAARKMKKIAKRQTKYTQKCLLFHGLFLLILPLHLQNAQNAWTAPCLGVAAHGANPMGGKG